MTGSKAKPRPYGANYKREMKRLARSKGMKKSAVEVLSVMLDCVHYDTGQSRPGKSYLIDESGYEKKAVQRALRDLREAGLIRPLAYENGGRGHTTVYGFALPAWAGHGDRTSTLKGVQSVPKGGAIRPERGCNAHPPTEESYRTGEKAAPSRRDDGPARGACSAETRQFADDMRRHGYAEAKRRADARKDAASAAAMKSEGGENYAQFAAE